MRTILLVNHSARADLTPAWLSMLANVIALQIQRDVAPDYGREMASVLLKCDENDSHLRAHGIDPDSCETVGIFDDQDQPNVLGYHDKGPNGLPFGKAFAMVDGQPVSLESLSVTASHEGCELFINPDGDDVKFGSGDNVGRFLEICDAVEDVAYMIEGYPVSDYVLPAWFEAGAPGPYSYVSRACIAAKNPPPISAPLTRTQGGYVIELQGTNVTTDPPERADLPSKAHPTSRLSKIQRKHAAPTPENTGAAA